MSVVRGDNVIVYIYSDGLWKLYACGRSCTLDVQTEFIETTVSGSGKWATFLPTKNSFSGSFDGVVNLDEPTMLTLPQLRVLQAAQTELMFRFQRTAESSSVYTDEGRVFIKSSSDTGTYNDVNTFSIEVVGNGVLGQLFITTPNPSAQLGDMRYEFTTTAGQLGFVDVILENKYIVEFVLDGIGLDRILLNTGTPVGKEVRYIVADGDFEWAVPAEAGMGGYIIYRDL